MFPRTVRAYTSFSADPDVPGKVSVNVYQLDLVFRSSPAGSLGGGRYCRRRPKYRSGNGGVRGSTVCVDLFHERIVPFHIWRDIALGW
jgi:hypothetical protein